MYYVSVKVTSCINFLPPTDQMYVVSKIAFRQTNKPIKQLKTVGEYFFFEYYIRYYVETRKFF